MGDTCCYIILYLRFSQTQQVKYTVPCYSHLVSWTRLQRQNTFIQVQPYTHTGHVNLFLPWVGLLPLLQQSLGLMQYELEDQPTSVLPCNPLQSCHPPLSTCALDWLAEDKWGWRKVQWAGRGKLQVPSTPPSIGLLSMASVQNPSCIGYNLNTVHTLHESCKN